MTAAAFGADLPLKAPPAAIAAVGSWSGFYVGAHAGAAFDHTSGALSAFPENVFTAPTARMNATGALGGLQAGYNYQIGGLVLGVEQDVSFTSLKGSSSQVDTSLGVPATINEDWKLNWLASTRGRIGYAPNAQWLIYGTGGVAYGEARGSTSQAFPALAYVGSRSDLLVGWIAGAGVQYALNDNWSIRGEYLHYDLGDMQVIGLPTIPNPPFQSQARFGWHGDIVRAGIDYKFGLPSAPASASLMPTKAVKAPTLLSDWRGSFGGRYWYSTGSSRKNIYGAGPTANLLISRLSYDDLSTHAAEAFFRVDHRSGVFVKGYGGLGALASGNQHDEDFPPVTVPYSNTQSSIRNSNISYFSADLGYDFLRTDRYRLGGFVGYHYDREVMNEYGCAQTASGTPCTPAVISTAVLGITDENRWQSVRLGLNGSVQLIDRLSLTVDAAWLPYTRLDGSDTHWLRQSPVVFGGLNGALPEDGVGHNGYQFEALLDYKLTDAFSVGVGGRYWHMETKGNIHFENVAIPVGVAQGLDYKLDRYGAFVQGAYHF